MAILMIVLMVAGFAPSFFLRGLVFTPRPVPELTPLTLVHGVTFSLWMLVFWAQTALVAAGRRDLHMKLGAAGLALAVLLVPMMYWVAVYQVARANQPPFTTSLAWTSVPLAAIPAYAILIWQGWRKRRDAQAHKRLMLGAALLFMAPSVGRLPLHPPTLAGHAFGQTLAWLCFAPLIWWDWRTLGRLHWATRLGAGVALAAMAVPVVLMATGSWDAVAARLPGI
jgi:hypothetical protein